MSKKEQELKREDVMENAHLLNRFRQELGWTVNKMCQEMGVSDTKMSKYILKGQLKVSELEHICRLWNIPITSFFSKDLLPSECSTKDYMSIKNVSNKKGDNNFFQETQAKYKSQSVDSLLIERKKTIKILEEQLKHARGDIEFLKKQLDKAL